MSYSGWVFDWVFVIPCSESVLMSQRSKKGEVLSFV